MVLSIDMMADIGEGFGPYSIGDDEAILRLLTSANVACGFHAGDPMVMDRTVRTCAARSVAVGAHPGFADRQGFGRRPVRMSSEQVRCEVLYQLGALAAVARRHGLGIQHVTPHGSLGNLCVTHREYAEGLADAVEDFDPSLIVVTQTGELSRLAAGRGLNVAITGMIDRAYNVDGSLVARSSEGAVLHDPDQIAQRAVRMVLERTVIAYDGTVIDIDCDTLLIHGDSPVAVGIAEHTRAVLEDSGVSFRPLRMVTEEKADRVDDHT